MGQTTLTITYQTPVTAAEVKRRVQAALAPLAVAVEPGPRRKPTKRPTKQAIAQAEFRALAAQLKEAVGSEPDQMPVEELVAGVREVRRALYEERLRREQA